MTTLLLDAGVLLAAFDSDDPQHEPARDLLGDDRVTLATIDLARYEVANLAVRAWRAPETAAPLLEAIDRLAGDGGVLVSSPPLIARAVELAERHVLSVYDAAYVAASAEGDLRLVSCDTRDLVSKGLAALPSAALAGAAGDQ